jgi:hypothetical protein
MKNQKPFMFLTRRGGFHATTKMHDLDTGEIRDVDSESQCRNSHELSAYRACVEQASVICMGKLVVEPIS